MSKIAIPYGITRYINGNTAAGKYISKIAIAEDLAKLGRLTESEKKRYNYIRFKEGDNAALQYLKNLEPELTQRDQNAQLAENTPELAQELESEEKTSGKATRNGKTRTKGRKNRTPLTAQQRVEICEKTGWSKKLVENIRFAEEAEIYMAAGLKEVTDGKRIYLIRSDIDMDQVTEDGRTNREHMAAGDAPIAKNGEVIHLHHIGQKADSPLAELTFSEHMKNGNYRILHTGGPSLINRIGFGPIRKNHWIDRSNTK